MSELIQFIFSLEDPTGRTIIWWIFICFGVGALNYLVHIAQIVLESLNLKRVQTYIKINHGFGDIAPELLNELDEAKVSSPRSIIYRRIRDLVQIKQKGGQIDNDALADIHAGEASRKAGLSNYILGILIILGLIGTLRGLITAIIEVQPLLRDIQDLDQLPTISDALRLTLSGMSTAFVTTLAGLVTSIALGLLGWLFNLANSAFLTKFERYVSTEILPYFTQAPESAIDSNIKQLTDSTNTLKFTTKENARIMNDAIHRLTDTSWGGFLDQLYGMSMNFGETSKDLLESLRKIKEHQAIIENTVADFKDTTATSVSQIAGVVDSFEKLITTSMSKISEYQSSVESYKDLIGQSMGHVADYQEALRKGLENSVESFRELIAESMAQVSENQEALGKGLESTVESFRELIAESMVQVSGYQEALQEGLENSVESFRELIAESMVQVSGYQEALQEGLENAVPKMRAESEVFKATILEYQNSQAEFVDQLADKLLNILQPIVDRQEVMVQDLHNVAGELQIRSALEKQNQVFEGFKTQLIENQNETVNILSKLIDELQIRPELEAQNKVFGRIENHLAGQGELVAEQRALMHTLNTSIQQLQQIFSRTAADEQLTQQMLHQLSLISLNFATLNEKMDSLNHTMSQPGLYRWGSEVRRWFGIFHK